MKKHRVILHPDAELDIELSFKGGCRAWGEENAKLWVRKLRKTTTSLPLACPLAPESEQLNVSIRHLIVGERGDDVLVRFRRVGYPGTGPMIDSSGGGLSRKKSPRAKTQDLFGPLRLCAR